MKSRQECFDFEAMVHMVTGQLRAFLEYNNVPPGRIICYRDGVAHDQFEQAQTPPVSLPGT